MGVWPPPPSKVGGGDYMVPPALFRAGLCCNVNKLWTSRSISQKKAPCPPFFSSADYSQAELIWYKSVRRPASGVRRRTSTFSNCYFSYIFQWILWKLGTLVSWVSPQTLFFSEFWNLDFLIFYEFSSNFHWNRYCPYNFQWFKLLLLLHFSMDSFETRYTYFLGQSPNFVLFRILKFGFSDLLWIFIKIYWNCYFSYIFQSILLKLGTFISWVSPQTLFFSEFWNLDFLIFY